MQPTSNYVDRSPAAIGEEASRYLHYLTTRTLLLAGPLLPIWAICRISRAWIWSSSSDVVAEATSIARLVWVTIWAVEVWNEVAVVRPSLWVVWVRALTVAGHDGCGET